ncbi:hypothetical protein UPYG_G00276610 [Umbra pygmaea]|uniref:C1q domain-containing protein n=1 Tax=Umbra pygmaea TaxID=75934 RepID=A0ABD0W431_UMBPY
MRERVCRHLLYISCRHHARCQNFPELCNPDYDISNQQLHIYSNSTCVERSVTKAKILPGFVVISEMESMLAVLLFLSCYAVETQAQVGPGSTPLLSEGDRLLKELTAKVDKLEKNCGDKPEVAFSAFLLGEDGQDNFGPYDADAVLMYNEVTTNIGGAYNPTTGNFTAPFGGVYHFIFSCSAGNTKKVNAELLKNGVNMAAVSETANPASGIYHGGASGVTLQLAKGDQVSVVIRKGSSIYNNNRINTFTGYLLFSVNDP